jgi:hypothetical protein
VANAVPGGHSNKCPRLRLCPYVGSNAVKTIPMRMLFYIFSILFSTGLTSCILSKKATDKSVVKYVSNNIELVKEAAEFFVSTTYNQSRKDFLAKDILDKQMREKVISLGVLVNVAYENRDYSEIPDSSVTFKTTTLFGVTEIIYDFAATQRTFADNTKNRKDYYFVKVADRIYYRRRQIPMM